MMKNKAALSKSSNCLDGFELVKEFSLHSFHLESQFRMRMTSEKNLDIRGLIEPLRNGLFWCFVMAGKWKLES